MDSPEPVRVSLPALPEDSSVLQERADDLGRRGGDIRQRVGGGLAASGGAHQAGTSVVNFRHGSDRYASSFYHGPDGHSVDRCE